MFVYHTKSNFELLVSLISASFCSFAVAMIGVAQIAPGAALNAVSIGLASPVTNGLIVEGVGYMLLPNILDFLLYRFLCNDPRYTGE